MSSEADLFQFLPSRRTDILAEAIGHRLIEIERLFLLDLERFLEDKRFESADYFSYNSGPVQLSFEGGLRHVLDVWGEQLSIIVLQESLQGDQDEQLYRLSEMATAPQALKDCLGEICLDVRIWTLKEPFESEEAKEVAVSYLLANQSELFYCIYLHGDLDSDYLLLGPDVSRENVESCFSVAQGGYIDPDG